VEETLSNVPHAWKHRGTLSSPFDGAVLQTTNGLFGIGFISPYVLFGGAGVTFQGVMVSWQWHTYLAALLLVLGN